MSTSTTPEFKPGPLCGRLGLARQGLQLYPLQGRMYIICNDIILVNIACKVLQLYLQSSYNIAESPVHDMLCQVMQPVTVHIYI